MNVSSNITTLRPEWLIPQQPGQQCQPHSHTFGLMWLYMVLSVFISILMASPCIFGTTKRFTDTSLDFFKATWRRIWCLPPEDRSEEKFDWTEPALSSLLLSLVGSVGISIASPVLTGLALKRQNRSVNMWILISQWSLRPRPTWISITLEKMLSGSPKDSNLPDGFTSTLFVSLLSDSILNVIGMPFLIQQVRYYSPKAALASLVDPTLPPTPINIQSDFVALLVFICIQIVICLLPLLFIVLSLLLVAIFSWENTKVPVKLPIWYIILLVTFISSTWICALMTWAKFFRDVPVSEYCLGVANTKITIIYCLLPVCLGLWRVLCHSRA
ncbi:hypothetical protein BGZ60DRAFT_423209 [Tricladium varicosporioides]|nr:hypothetical protein BGZ60DRAFT_423209 [Hymenoscyphus varicosporioides]